MFASPFEYCQLCNEYVLLDATARQCAREHQCREPASACPLRHYFTGIEFGAAAKAVDGKPPSGKPPRPG